MSENTQAVETEALEQDVTQEEQVETKQEKAERTFTRAEFGKAIAAGERLAKLTKDERAKEEEAKRIQAIEERERALAIKEMRVATQTLLSEEGLPSEFIDFVIDETAEATKEKIGTLRQIFDKAVEARVDERLTQKAPRKGTGPVSMTKAEIMAIENDEERQAMIAANIGLFKK